MHIRQKRILLDVDDVCTDFKGSLLYELGTALNLEGTHTTNIFELMDSQTQARAQAILDDTEFWRALKPYEAAQEGVERFRSLGSVYFATKPWPTCHGWETVRRAWLAQHFPENASRLGVSTNQRVAFLEAKYLLQGDMFIDDNIHNVESWAMNNPQGRAFLFSTRYNAAIGGLPKGEHSVWSRFSWAPSTRTL